MFLKSLDNKRSQVILAQGATVKKSSDDNSWFLDLNSDNSNNFVVAPNTFDSCITDADSLCTFGFTVNIWFKFSFDTTHIVKSRSRMNLEKLEQILFFTGSANLGKIDHGYKFYLTLCKR